MISVCSSILYFLLYHKDILIQYSDGKNILVYIVLLFLVLSFIISTRYLFDTRYSSYNLTNFFFSIIIPQFISISLLYNFGIVGNPNYKLKSFINDDFVSKIINDNTIYLYNVDSKINTLLRYYLPSAKILESTEDIEKYNYLITSDRQFIQYYQNRYLFKSIKNFDNHFLLMNVSK